MDGKKYILDIPYKPGVVLITLLIASLVSFTVLSQLGWVRLIMGILFVSFLPGHSMIEAVFPCRRFIDGIGRLGLSLGLSFPIMSMFGLLNNFTPWGLNTESMIVTNTFFIIICAVIANYRSKLLNVQDRNLITLHFSKPHCYLHNAKTNLISLMLIISFGFSCVALLYAFTRPKTGEQFTEFYIVSINDRKASDYPDKVKVKDELSIIVGLINKEQHEHSYKVEVWAREYLSNSDRSLLLGSTELNLLPGEISETRIAWNMPEVGADKKLELILKKDEYSSPAGTLWLWLDVIPSSD